MLVRGWVGGEIVEVELGVDEEVGVVNVVDWRVSAEDRLAS